MSADDDDWIDQLTGREPSDATTEALRGVLLEYAGGSCDLDEIRQKRRQLALLQRLQQEDLIPREPQPFKSAVSGFKRLTRRQPLALAASVAVMLIGGLLVSQRSEFQSMPDPEIRVGSSAPPVIAEQEEAARYAEHVDAVRLDAVRQKAEAAPRYAQQEDAAARQKAEAARQKAEAAAIQQARQVDAARQKATEAAIQQARKRDSSPQKPPATLPAYQVTQVPDIEATLRYWKSLFIKYQLPYRIMADPKGTIVRVQVGSPPPPAIQKWLERERLTPDANGRIRVLIQKKKP